MKNYTIFSDDWAKAVNWRFFFLAYPQSYSKVTISFSFKLSTFHAEKRMYNWKSLRRFQWLQKTAKLKFDQISSMKRLWSWHFELCQSIGPSFISEELTLEMSTFMISSWWKFDLFGTKIYCFTSPSTQYQFFFWETSLSFVWQFKLQ